MNLTLLLVTTLALGLFYSWTSRINAHFFFGRTVSAEVASSIEGRAITRQYLLGIGVATLASAMAGWAASHAGVRPFATASLLLEIVLASVVFARANGRVKQLLQQQPDLQQQRQPVREASLLDQPRYWIPGLPAVFAPLALCLAAIAGVILPGARARGLSAGWTAFSQRVDAHDLAFVLGMACGLIAAAAAVLLTFRVSVRLRTRIAQYSVRASFAMLWIGTALFIGTLLSDANGIVMSRTFSRALVLLAVVAAVAVMLWNQARSKRFVPAAVEVGADDRWRWGLFYVDRADPALFVQSRCGTGYTLNYGRIAAWPISLGLVAYLVATMFLLPHLH